MMTNKDLYNGYIWPKSYIIFMLILKWHNQNTRKNWRVMSQCQTCLVLVSQVINSGCGLWKSGFRLLGLMTLSGWHLTIDCVFTIGTLLHNGIDLFRLSCWLICFLFPQKLKETQLADSLLKKKCCQHPG